MYYILTRPYFSKEFRLKAKCGNCKFYLGYSDWNLCCSNLPKDEVSWARFLCYRDTDLYQNYRYKKRGEANEVKSNFS